MENSNSTAFLSKDGQKILREQYEIALRDIWKNRKGEADEKMVKYCLSRTAVIVPLHDGRMVIIEKPNIEKDFCFGYSTCGQGSTYDECMKTHSAASADLDNYFKEKNLEYFDKRYEDYIEAQSSEGRNLYAAPQYHSQSNSNPVRCLSFKYDDELVPEYYEDVTSEDVNNFVLGISFVRTKFVKSIDTYLKKYGTKKIRTWTYWVDE